MKQVTFEDIQRVNATLKTTDIKGKPYVEVNEKIKGFRALFGTEGFIKSDIVACDAGNCIIKAVAGQYDDEHREIVLGDGIAYEKEGSSFINKTSYIENCQTSAIGRALSMIGIGIDTSIASYEEVANAIKNQNKKSNDLPVRKQQIITIKQLYSEEEINKMLNNIGVEKIEQITSEQAETMIAKRTVDDETPTY